MNGRAEVARLKQRLDATFQRIAGVGYDLELLSALLTSAFLTITRGYRESLTGLLTFVHRYRE